MSEMLKRPRILEAERSGQTLAQHLGATIRDVTVADAAAKTGLALRDAERGLQWAITEYRGHLKVTEGGDLLFHFPHGFTRPWKTTETAKEWLSRVGKGLWTVAKVGIKVWILVAILMYTAVFVAILIGMLVASMAGNRDDRDDDRGFSFGDFLMWRLVADLIGDAIFATFHYRAIRDYDALANGGTLSRRGPERPKRRLYEKVFQFIFGPEKQPADPMEQEKLVLALIRQREGRIGVMDVMAVTGLVHDDAERLITRLLVDYEGEIEVSDEGAVFYVFKDLRKTADVGTLPSRVPMSWERPVQVTPLTGDNSPGTNLTVVALNTFNLCMSGFAIASDLTLANLSYVLQGVPIEALPSTGTPLFLGWVPFLYSLSIFAVPAGRSLVRMKELAKATWENGKRGVLQLITRDPVTAHPPTRLSGAFESVAGTKPEEKQLDHLLLQLGGDLQVTDSGQQRWRFPDLARESRALSAARASADSEEKLLGPVVFDTEK